MSLFRWRSAGRRTSFAGVTPSRPARLLHATRTLARAAGSSLAAVAVEVGLLTVLVTFLHVAYLIGSVIAGVVYLVVNFVLNRRWAFRNRAPVGPQLLRHGVVSGGGTMLGLPLLRVFVDGAHMPLAIAWTISAAIAFLAWTFPMHRLFTYRTST
jgi:putative flippase GtrA